jgi:hypothetical protein
MSDWTDPYEEKKKFLADLKVGDKVACGTRRLNTGAYTRNYGYEVHTITKITPSRAKIVTSCGDQEWTFGKDGTCKVGGGWGADYFTLKPLTAEITESMRLDTLRIKAMNRRNSLVDALNSRKDFANESEDFHMQFLAASQQLLELLNKAQP